jgi:hypothetical protein
LTYFYEGYYDVWQGGKYFLRIAEMHKKYGPIVRITPHEVHFADPEFLEALYPVGGRKTDKPSWFALLTGSKAHLPSSALCLQAHSKQLRIPLSPPRTMSFTDSGAMR